MANLPLTQLELPSGSVYDVVDQGARDLIAALNQFTYLVVSSLPTPNETTMYKIYLVAAPEPGASDVYEEYITIDKGDEADPRYVWEKFGTITTPDLSNYVSKAEAGDLAYKDTASGTVSVPSVFGSTFAGTQSNISVAGTPAGTVSQPSFSGTAGTVNVSGTPIAAATTFSGGYTPAGSISVASAGGTTTIKNPTSKTVVTNMSVSDPAATAATGELLYCTVDGTKLTLHKIIETSGDSITTSNVTVKNGDPSYSFSGTASTVSVSGTPSMSATTFSGAFTPAGSVSQPTFTGALLISTGTYTPAGTVNTTATETSKTVTVS